LLHRFFWKHKGPKSKQRYSQVFLDHFLIDSAGANARTLGFLIDTLGEERVVFGSDYCGGLGPLKKAFAAIEGQSDSAHFKSFTERNSVRLLGL